MTPNVSSILRHPLKSIGREALTDVDLTAGAWLPFDRLTAASINWLMATMSKVSGARYSTLAPVSCAAFSTPFLTTDQNGSEAWPWLTTMMSWAAAGAAIAIAAAASVDFTRCFIGSSLN